MHKVAKYLPWMVGGGALFFLIAHSTRWTAITVDSTTLALLGMIAIAPIIEKIRKIKFGDLEAEIAPHEVSAIESAASSEIKEAQVDDAYLFEDELVDLVHKDPVLGLAKVRIEIERILRSIRDKVVASGGEKRRGSSIMQLLRDIHRVEPLPDSMLNTLDRVSSLANRAIHGERIRPEDAETMVRIGAQVIGQLQSFYRTKLLDCLDKQVITPGDVDKYRTSRYRVTSVIPYVNDPVRIVRILYQEELEDMLDGYDEYAEFIVSVEIIPSH